MKKQNILVFIISASLIFNGLFLILGQSMIVDCLLSLQCNPILYHLWKNIPVDVPTEIYFFNWTNPEDIYNRSIKPKFEENGPYTFLQKEEKCNIVWNDNGTVTFQQRKFWYYDKTVENGNLKDVITSVDPTILGISSVTRTWNAFVRKGIFLTLGPFFRTIHESHPVSELIFDGYPAQLMKIASPMPIFAHLKLPRWDRFGWMYDRNGSSTTDGVFNMGTGSNSILGQLYNWNYQPQTEYFEGECGEVAGSAGQFFPRNLKKDYIKLFSYDIRRTLTLYYAGHNIVNNILGYKYMATNVTLDNGTLVPENKCFCAGECMPSGVFNLSLSRHQTPLFVSMPHFYGADPYYLSQIEGLKPQEDHGVSFTIEPTTGVILEADATLQGNLLIRPTPGMRLFENVPKFYMPILWTRQKAKIPKRETLFLKIVLAVPTICVSVGASMMVLGAILIYLKLRSCQKRKEKIKFTEEEAMMMVCQKTEMVRQ